MVYSPHSLHDSAQSSAQDGSHVRAPWLLAAKVRPPALVNGYFRRADLQERIEPLRPLTVFKAPGGFGKTCLLADICQRWLRSGRVAAWLTMDEDDGADVLDAHLAHALKTAGIRLPSLEGGVSGRAGSVMVRPRRRTEQLVAAVEAHREPCLLLLDNVDRLRDPDAVASLDFLLHHRPRNLHVALALRDNPGLDLAKAVLDGEGLYLTADQLRFSKPQIELFFGGELSRRELASLQARTEGWPVALRVFRNMKTGDYSERRSVTVRDLAGDRGLAAEWFGERLLHDLPDADRELLLDLALFDWIAPALVAEVLGEDDMPNQLARFVGLDGLLNPDEGTNNLRFNPLLKDYCAARRFQEDPVRFERVHRRIARAQANMGHVIPALRHASEAGDDTLIGEILEDAGGVRLWARFGAKCLVAVDGFLADEVVAQFPRAGLLRCVAFVIKGDFRSAFALYATVKAYTNDFERDRPGGDDEALRFDHALVQATLVGFSCLRFSNPLVGQVIDVVERIASVSGLAPVVEGALNLALSMADQQRARFDSARRRGAVAKRTFAQCGAGYGGIFVNLHSGCMAMAQGRVAEAADCYLRGGPTTIADILSMELDYERKATRIGKRLPDLGNARHIGWLDVYAAAHQLAAELIFETGGAEAALMSVSEAHRRARASGLAAVARFLLALRVSWLVKDGLADEAERSWRRDGLPTTMPAMLDLDAQSWREMEAIACARISLLTAQGAFDAGRQLLDKLQTLASERGLMRVLMSGKALSIVLERRAGDEARAVGELVEYLRLCRETDYVRPLARQRDDLLAVLPLLLDGFDVLDGLDEEPPDTLFADSEDRRDVHQRAQVLFDQMRDDAAVPIFTARELAIIAAVEHGQRNKEIALSLGLTQQAVRYHLSNIYRKADADGRLDMVRRVRALGPATH